MGLRNTRIRAVASALLVTAAVGTGGMAGMSSALAAGPATVGLAGTVVNHDGGAPLGGVPLVITEIVLPAGAAVAVQTTTGADGSFAVELEALGSADAPATVSIKTPADTMIEVIGDSCSQTWSVAIDADQDLTLSGAVPDPVTLTATTTLMGEVCGTTGVPATSHGGGTANITPPPTNTLAAPTGAPDQLEPALTIAFVAGLLAAATLLLPRPRGRRRD